MREALQGSVDGGEVAGDDRFAALGVRLLDEALDPGDGLVRRQDARELEEARLHDRVDPAAHADLIGDGQRVDHPQVDLLVDELLLDATRQVIPDLIGAVWGVEQERRPVPGGLEHVRLAEESELMAGDEVGLLHEIGRPDRLGPEAQVRHRDRARLLRVVHEVALGKEVRALADDLHRCLVCADGAVGTESEEDGLHLTGRTLRSELDIDRAG